MCVCAYGCIPVTYSIHVGILSLLTWIQGEQEYTHVMRYVSAHTLENILYQFDMPILPKLALKEVYWHISHPTEQECCFCQFWLNPLTTEFFPPRQHIFMHSAHTTFVGAPLPQHSLLSGQTWWGPHTWRARPLWQYR